MTATRGSAVRRLATPVASEGLFPYSPLHTGPTTKKESLLMSMYIGEALVGEGNEIAHIDLLLGSKDGVVGAAFANALANQSAGHNNLLAVIAPNLICK